MTDQEAHVISLLTALEDGDENLIGRVLRERTDDEILDMLAVTCAWFTSAQKALARAHGHDPNRFIIDLAEWLNNKDNPT